jgi:hypothetical protein
MHSVGGASLLVGVPGTAKVRGPAGGSSHGLAGCQLAAPVFASSRATIAPGGTTNLMSSLSPPRCAPVQTCVVNQFMSRFNSETTAQKTITFSSLTTPQIFQVWG